MAADLRVEQPGSEELEMLKGGRKVRRSWPDQTVAHER